MRAVGLLCLWLSVTSPVAAQPDVSNDRLGGVGLVVAKREGRLFVIRAVPGTPAAAAGIRTGDLVVAIDAASVAPMTLDEAVRRIAGRPGTRVELTFLRPDSAGRPGSPRRVQLVRELLRIEPPP